MDQQLLIDKPSRAFMPRFRIRKTTLVYRVYDENGVRYLGSFITNGVKIEYSEELTAYLKTIGLLNK